MDELVPVRKLVLLPGMDGTGMLFGPFIDALPLGFEALPVSYPTDRPLTYSQLTELVRVRLPVSESFVLLAESFSTPIAIQIAAENPPGLKAVILVAGFATNPTYHLIKDLSPLIMPSFSRRRLSGFLVKRYLLGADAPPTIFEAVQQAVHSVSPEVMASRAKLILERDSRADLAHTTVPILYVQATQDRVVPRRCLSEIVAIRPDVTVAQVEGPHLLLQREPQKSAEMITHFIQQLG